jgi:peptidyl-prolyl cis-trans isomerase D
MLKSIRASTSKIFFMVILGLLIIGLAGWGIQIGGAGTDDIARVGDAEISREAYARALDQELRRLSSQTGRNISVEEARQFGLDRAVLARLVNAAALDNEADRIGLSTGDAAIGSRIRDLPAFAGPGGEFDREAYSFALERIGTTPRAFEEQVREEATRELLAQTVTAAATMPDSAATTLLDHHAERRSFHWLRLDADVLEEPVPEPTDTELQAFYEANGDDYMRPETRRITFASLTPEALAADVEIPEERLREAYEAAGPRFQQPERRILDRIGFASQEEAAAARARLEAGEIGFAELAEERGLTGEEIDQGIVAAGELAAEAREAVFAAEGPGIVGPVATPLGPSIFRINGILAAETTPFEEARDELRGELALEEARAQILAELRPVEDLVAGGATVEELAAETALEQGTMALNAETSGGLAEDSAFRQAAEAAAPGIETDPIELADGGLAVLRVDAVEPARPIPLAEIRDRVAADWRAAETAERLMALAEGYAAELASGVGLEQLAGRLDSVRRTAGPLTRGETAPDVPPALIPEIFAAEVDAAVVHPAGSGEVILAQVAAVEAFDPDEAEGAQLVADLRQQIEGQAVQEIIALYTAALQAEAGVSFNQTALDATLDQYR